MPDETTMCRFRHLLEEKHLGEEILGTVTLDLQAWDSDHGGHDCGSDPGESVCEPQKTARRGVTPFIFAPYAQLRRQS